MAATCLARDPINEIHLFEKRAGLGRKLLIAGSSGLNISHHASPRDFALHYEGFDQQYWERLFQNFGPDQWIQFIEKELVLETFLGTSDRYFVREMKASGLLKSWTRLLEDKGVVFHVQKELRNFESSDGEVKLWFGDESTPNIFSRAYFFLGGGSWETEEPSWAQIFRKNGIEVQKFEPSNVGYEVDWSPDFLKEAEGKPLKKIVITTSSGTKAGELMVTNYGLEGTPIYFHGGVGEVLLDLKPDLTADKIFLNLQAVKENLSPMRRVKQKLGLCEASLALLFHHTPVEIKNDLKKLIERVKKFPVQLKAPRPLSESISSKGGVALSELDEDLQLKKFKNIFCGGEMLDWDAPTGGFLIQASVSQGAWMGRKVRGKTKNPL